MAEREFIPVHVGVLTVSDTRTRENDVSGDTLAKRIEALGGSYGVQRRPDGRHGCHIPDRPCAGRHRGGGDGVVNT